MHLHSVVCLGCQGGSIRRLEEAERSHQPLKASVDNRYYLRASNQQQAWSLLFLMWWSDRCKIPRALDLNELRCRAGWLIYRPHQNPSALGKHLGTCSAILRRILSALITTGTDLCQRVVIHGANEKL